MSYNNTPRGGYGLTFSGALFLLFLGLRLTGHIDWAWYWIAAPLWIPLALGLVLLGVAWVVISLADDKGPRDQGGN